MILSIRTDKPEAEIGLHAIDGRVEAYETWQAHRELAETIHKKIAQLCNHNEITLQDITGIIAFKGPGSFTGLRIGLTVANTLAYGLNIPIISASGEDWIRSSLDRLQKNEDERVILPEYGAEAHITSPKK